MCQGGRVPSVHHICQAPLRLGVSVWTFLATRQAEVCGQKILESSLKERQPICPSLLAPSWCLAFRGDGKCSSSHLDPKGTLTMDAMLGGWQSRHITPSSWFTLYLFTRASFRWENCLSHIFCVFVFFILLANLILIDSDDEDYFFSEFKRSISLGMLQRLHLFQLLSNWVSLLEQASEVNVGIRKKWGSKRPVQGKIRCLGELCTSQLHHLGQVR